MWSALLVFALAFAYRAYLNRGQTWGTPDEKAYSTYAHSWKPGKVYLSKVQEFLDRPTLDIPPTRYAFFAICSFLVRLIKTNKCFQVVTWVAATSSALLALVAYLITHDLVSSLLVASSPLALLLSRRALQDTFAALTIVLAVWAIQLQNVWLLGAFIALAVASREALLLYVPALLVAWFLRTGDWVLGPISASVGVISAGLTFYALGGRKLIAIFSKLKQPTDYVSRFQSGMLHRVIVDLFLVSPVTMLVACMVCLHRPLWIVGFVGVALVTHAFVTPKNVRFLLAIDVVIRMLCAGLPGPWSWIVLGLGTLADFCILVVVKYSKDPVTYNLVIQTGIYKEDEDNG